MSQGFVYKWTNQINGRWYIGSHEGNETDGYIGSGKAFMNAVKKHGIVNFVREIIYKGDDFRKYEGELLTELDAMHDPMSYNLINDGIGASGKDNPAYGRTGDKHPMFGKHHTEKTKAIIAQKATNRIVSLKTRQKLKDALTPERRKQIGKISKAFLTGKTKTQSSKQQISRTLKEKLPASAKFTHEQAELIRAQLRSGKTIAELSTELNVDRHVISRIKHNKSYTRP